MDILKYKGFDGSAELCMERKICHGRLLFINDLVTYEASSPEGLEAEFRAAVEDYLETCAALNREPQKPFQGQFNVRITPDLHRAAAVNAAAESVSLNEIVARSIAAYVHAAGPVDQAAIASPAKRDRGRLSGPPRLREGQKGVALRR